MVDPAEAFSQALQRLAPGFGEDFFLGHGHAKLNRSLTANATAATPESAKPVEETIPQAEQFKSWMRFLRVGFNVLVQGVGSTRQLLQEFVDQEVKPAGIRVVHLNAFDARSSLVECLKSLLEQAFPKVQRQGNSAEGLVATVRSALAMPESRPWCFVVHSLENLPRHHMVALASLAASPGAHLVASTDHILAPLAWDSRCLKDFNFVFKDVHTFAGYEMEATARQPRGLPAWCGLGKDKRRNPRASLALVMRSLTNNHRELVQAMAEEQLETEHNTGISMPALLKVATDRLIANTVPKLRSLLNELIDHEVVIKRSCQSAITEQALFCLPFEERTLTQLRDGRALDSEDEAADAVPAPVDEAADDMVLA